MNVSAASNAINFSAYHANTGASTDGARAHCSAESAHGGEATRVRGGGFGKLVNAIFQAFGQTATGLVSAPTITPATPATPTVDAAVAPEATAGSGQNQDFLQKLQTFVQTLFSALGQMGGHGHDHGHEHCHGENTVSSTPPTTGVAASTIPTSATVTTAQTNAPPIADTPPVNSEPPTSTTQGVSATPPSPIRHYQQYGHRGGLESKLQSMLQEIANSSASTPTTGPLADLNSAFLNLFSAHSGDGTEPASAPPTLQGFLQNLMQNLSSGATSAGVASGNFINATA